MDVTEVYKKIASRALQQGNRKLADALRNPKRRPEQKVTELFAEDTQNNQPMPAVMMSPPPITQQTPSVPRENVLLEFMQEYAKDVRPPQQPQESREEMQAGGMAGEPFAAPQEAQEQAPMAEAGATVVGDPAEGTSEQESIADDVAVDVPEGAFVVNAPAVEQAGLKDLIKKVEDAYETANREGIDISSQGTTMSKEDTVNLLVSRGELIISPEIAKVIGYETLEKINNRGKEEVARRQQVAEQQQQQPQNQQQSPLEGELVRAAEGGQITQIQGAGSFGDSGARANISGEYRGDGFAVRPSVNYSEQSDTMEYPDGVVVDSTGKNLGFAVNGEMFLTDDSSLRAGIQRQSSRSNQTVKLPDEMGGETLEFGGGQKMKRYNMGATFGDISADISKTQGSGQPISGRVQYKFSPDGNVFIEGTDDGRSGRIGLNYRF